MTKSAVLFDRYFYLIMSLVIAGVVIYGYSHTINENLIHPAYPRPLVLYFHAAIFTGWVALLITQSALIRARNIKLHRKLGLCALALAIARFQWLELQPASQWHASILNTAAQMPQSFSSCRSSIWSHSQLLSASQSFGGGNRNTTVG